MINGDDVSKGKPNPEIFLLAKDKFPRPDPNTPLEADMCLVFEDSSNGIEAALAGNFKGE